MALPTVDSAGRTVLHEQGKRRLHVGPSPNYQEDLVTLADVQPNFYPVEAERLIRAFQLAEASQLYEHRGGAAIAAILVRQLKGGVLFDELFFGRDELAVLHDGMQEVTDRELSILAQALAPAIWDNSVTQQTLLGRVRALVGLIAAAEERSRLQDSYHYNGLREGKVSANLSVLILALLLKLKTENRYITWRGIPLNGDDAYEIAGTAYRKLLGWRERIRLFGLKGVFGS